MTSEKSRYLRNLPFLSIIVPTLNENEMPAKLMRAASHFRYPHDKLELIVVFNAEVALEDFPREFPYTCKFTRERKRGRSAARNRGIIESRGDWILFLDDDVIPGEELLIEHMRMHTRFPSSVVLGEVLPAQDTAFPDRFELQSLFGFQKDGELLEYNTLTSNLSLKKSHIASAGLFDEDFDIYGFEDIELGYRLMKIPGLSLRYGKRARVWHRSCKSLSRLLNDNFERGISFIKFIRKHPYSLMDPRFRRTSNHLRSLYGRAKSFEAHPAERIQEELSKLHILEKICREQSNAGKEREFFDTYRMLMSHSFYEGASSSINRENSGAKRRTISNNS